MIKFNIGDQIEADLSDPLNKDVASESTKILLEHLKTHPNVFTVYDYSDSTTTGSCILFLNELGGGFFSGRFRLMKSANITVTEDDLGDLLND